MTATTLSLKEHLGPCRQRTVYDTIRKSTPISLDTKSFSLGSSIRRLNLNSHNTTSNFIRTSCDIVVLSCLTSQPLPLVSQGWISSHNCTCCHTEIEVAGQTFYQHTGTRPTRVPSLTLYSPWQSTTLTLYSIQPLAEYNTDSILYMAPGRVHH